MAGLDVRLWKTASGASRRRTGRRAAVVVQVADGQSATQLGDLPRRPGAVRDVEQPAGPVTEEELGGHLEGDVGAKVIDVAVGLGQVEPAVVVGVERRQPKPRTNRRRRGEAGRGGPVAEDAVAVVVVEGGRLAEEVGHGQVDPAVAVEVAAGHAHPAR